MKRILSLIFGLLMLTQVGFTQNPPQSGATLAQAVASQYFVIPISTTAAVNNQVTLTIPAPPPGLYNYVCSLAFNISQDATSTAAVNVTTSSTNFNSFALKLSLAATANINYDWTAKFGDPAGGGCAKSTSPTTATTFVSPTLLLHAAFTWNATYFQAP